MSPPAVRRFAGLLAGLTAVIAAGFFAGRGARLSVDPPSQDLSTLAPLVPVPSDPFLTTRHAHDPSLAWNGLSFGIAWAEEHAARPAETSTHFRLLPETTYEASPGEPTTLGGGTIHAGPRLLPDVSRGGWVTAWYDFVVGEDLGYVWTAGMGIVNVAHLDTDGRVATSLRVTDTPVAPWCVRAAIGAGGITGVAWYDHGPEHGIRFARVSPAGAKIGGEAQLWSAFAGTACMDLAWSGSEYGVAFPLLRETRPQGEILLGRLTPLGERRDDAAWIGPGGRSAPSLVSDGRTWALAWVEERSLLFIRVDATGSPLGAELGPVHIAADPRAYEPMLAWNGAEYGLVWTSVDGDSGAESLYYQRLDAGGAIVGAPVRLLDPAGDYGKPTLAWGGTSWGLACERHDSAGGSTILFARFARDGGPIGPPLEVLPY